MTEMFEQNFKQIIMEAAEAHPDDVDAAVDASLPKLARLPEWEEYKKQLVRSAVSDLIHVYRHRENVEQRKGTGVYGGAAKVTRGRASAAIAREKSLYDYFIGGKHLGSVTGEELGAIAEVESAKAATHNFHVRLCSALSRIVPKEKTVREVVTERRLKTIWESAIGTKQRKST